MPAVGSMASEASVVASPLVAARVPEPVAKPAVIKLEGVMWGNPPVAIINGRSFFVNDVNGVKMGGTNETIQCLAIQHNLVRIKHVGSGKEQELVLPEN